MKNKQHRQILQLHVYLLYRKDARATLENIAYIHNCIKYARKLIFVAFLENEFLIIEMAYLIIGKLYFLEADYANAQKYFRMAV